MSESPRLFFKGILAVAAFVFGVVVLVIRFDKIVNEPARKAKAAEIQARQVEALRDQIMGDLSPKSELSKRMKSGGIKMAPARAASQAVLDDLSADKIVDAYFKLATDYRQKITLDEFTALIAKHPDVKQPKRRSTSVSARLAEGFDMSQSLETAAQPTVIVDFTATIDDSGTRLTDMTIRLPDPPKAGGP